MGIASQAQAGVQIQTPAKNGTLGSQAAAATDEIIFPTDLNTNNGNLGNTLFAGRLIRVRGGLSTEEIRYAVSEAGATVTVNEPWNIQPATSDAYEVSYILVDAATVTGLTYAAKADSYTSGRRFVVQSTGFFALRDGDMFETADNSSTTVADIIVESGGTLVVGYETGGSAVSGAFTIGTPALDNELVFDVQAGGELIANDLFLRCVKRNKSIFAGTCFLRRCKLYKAVAGADFTGIVTIRDSVIEGVGNVGDTVLIDDSVDMDTVQLTNTAGFTFPAATITVTISNLTFINNAQVGTLEANNTLILVDAIGAVDLSSTFKWNSTTGNSVEWKYSFDSTVADSDGVTITGAACYIYEGLLNQNLPLEGLTDGAGIFSQDILTNIYTGAGVGSTSNEAPRGSFRFQVYKYGYGTFSSSVAATAPEERPVGLVVDSTLDGISEATALAVSGVVITDHRGAPLSAQGKSWSWEVNCGGNTPLNAYANLRARFAEDPSTAPAIIKALIGQNQNLIEVSGGQFTTLRKEGDGVYLSNFAGNTGAMTADDGTTYTPPVSRTLTINVQNAAGTGITGYEWRLYENDPATGKIGTTELDGEESATVSQQTYPYNHPVTEPNCWIQIIEAGFVEALVAVTLGDADQTVTIKLQAETN